MVSPLVKTVFRPNEDKTEQFETGCCLGYFVYLFQNREVNDHAGNLITICPMHEWRRKGAGSVITGALFGTDVSNSQYRDMLINMNDPI